MSCLGGKLAKTVQIYLWQVKVLQLYFQTILYLIIETYLKWEVFQIDLLQQPYVVESWRV